MIVAGLVMAVITAFEATENSGQVPFRYYTSFGFIALLGLVWLNLFFNMIRPFWWRWKRLPLSLFHLGFLLILTGGCFTWALGMRGSLRMVEGEERATFQTEYPVLHVTWPAKDGQESTSFMIGQDGGLRGEGLSGWLRSLTSKNSVQLENGLRLTILDRLLSGRVESRVELAEPGQGPCAVTLEINGSRAETVVLQAGDNLKLDYPRLSRIVFRQWKDSEAKQEEIKDLFEETIEIRPPDGSVITFPVSIPEDVGKVFSREGYTVEVLEYHPDFKMGRTPDPRDAPRNPALRLRVQGPGSESERTLFAFAYVEFHGNRLEDGTEVAYQRPGTGRTLLLVARNAEYIELYQGAGQAPIRFSPEEPFSFDEDKERISLSLVSVWPSSQVREQVVPDSSGRGMPAFQVRIGEDGEPCWLFPGRGVALSRDSLTKAVLNYAFALGFDIALDDAVAEFWPGSSIPRAYYSHVHVTAPGETQARAVCIETNDPLFCNGFRLYQSDIDKKPPYRYSVFAVARDPGVPLVTAGFILLCLGMVWFFWKRFVMQPLRAQGRVS
ncbi:MAG: cytochrome c biogenesis protein ResB [Planctomycetota bacterium]